MVEQRLLVIGGCGFLGFHVVKALVSEHNWSVHVLSRKPSRNRVEGAQYHTGSVLSPD